MSAIKYNAGVIQQLEKKYVDYLYRKYINVNPTSEASDEEDKSAESAYMSSLFMSLAEVAIKNEVAEIRRATELYDADSERYPTFKTEYGYPELFRCKHICSQKKTFWRCKQKKNKGDADYCSVHLNMPNIHEGAYYQMCAKAAASTD